MKSDDRAELVLGFLLATAFWVIVAMFFAPTSALSALAGPASTVLAACAAAFVAYRLGTSQVSVALAQAQIAERTWQTNNEKIVLELMERRLAIYREIRDVIAEIMRSGRSEQDTLWKYGKAIDQVEFLFGQDVQDYLEKLRVHLIDFELGCSLSCHVTNEEYREGIKIKHREFKEILRFYREAPPIFGPYIRAHQKVEQ